MENYQSLFQKQKAFFHSGKTKEVSFRIEALKKLKEAIRISEKKIAAALQADLNKPEFEAYATEIGMVLKEIGFALNHIQSWVKPKKVKTPITHFGARSYIYSEPYGVTLIISPWNYPFQLALLPLIGAIAAGNCAIMKPSEFTPKTSQCMFEILKEIFPEDHIAVVQGDADTSKALLHNPFDYIFFTGSTSVGRLVMEAAAKNLTPVTLELGGKSPCIVHEDANLKLAAKRIAWGKFLNSGQTCIAPDYVYLHKSIADPFLRYLKDAIQELYGDQPLQNPNYVRIVCEKHFHRLCSFLNDGTIYTGGRYNRETLTIEPTILTHITWNDRVMQEEIFGPILPVLEYSDLSEVIEGIQYSSNPLSLYLFTEKEHVQKEVLHHISFGGGCINDTVVHYASPYLPFGGKGKSGIGAYHGKSSFDTFSHQKSVLKQTTLFDLPFRYPNFKNGLKWIKLFLR